MGEVVELGAEVKNLKKAEVLYEDVLDLHAEGGADAGKTVDYQRDAV